MRCGSSFFLLRSFSCVNVEIFLISYCIKYVVVVVAMENGSPLLVWRRVVLHESQCHYLSPLKENGVNRGIERSAGSDYTMDEVASYNEEYDSESSMIM